MYLIAAPCSERLTRQGMMIAELRATKTMCNDREAETSSRQRTKKKPLKETVEHD
jgi:hypothetical protein